MFEDSTHGGRQRNRAGLWGRIISTHALTEGDHQPAATGSPVSYFNSRPHGGRLHWLFFFAHQAIFQLTPSRRATSARVSTDAVEVAFQLTPSRRATARPFLIQLTNWLNFNSRPHGGRPKATAICSVVDAFQLTPSRRATMQVLLLRSRTSNFNSRPHGGRPSQMIRSASYSYFNSRPHGGRLTKIIFHCVW